MRSRLQRELARLGRAAGGVDRQAAVVLLLAPLLVIVQFSFGSRRFFLDHLAPLFEFEQPALAAWAWWFGMQGVTGFVVPAAVLLFAFRRPAHEAGLGRGDGRLALVLAALYLPLAALGTWVLSDGAAFQRSYPHFGPAALDWRLFAIYEALFLFYWIGWEYLWRGFVLFGTAPALGAPYAVLVQAVPFALLHVNKPLPEALLSVVGGVALGALVWRCRAFWIAVPIHAAQMLMLDLWCTLRIRSGAEGIGWEAFVRALGL